MQVAVFILVVLVFVAVSGALVRLVRVPLPALQIAIGAVLAWPGSRHPCRPYDAGPVFRDHLYRSFAEGPAEKEITVSPPFCRKPASKFRAANVARR
jgi:hypothetical protein